MIRALLISMTLLVLGTSASAAAGPAPEGLEAVFDLPKRWDLSIYTLIVFCVLLFLMGKFAWPAISAGMKAREDVIVKARDEAIDARKAAEAIRAELAAKMAAAQDEVKGIIEEARRDAVKLKAAERETGVKEAAAERDRAKREIATALEQAKAELYTKSVEIAALISSKAMRREMTAADHARLLDESLAELGTTVAAN